MAMGGLMGAGLTVTSGPVISRPGPGRSAAASRRARGTPPAGHRRPRPGLLHVAEGLLARQRQEVAVAQQVAHAQARQAGLAGAEEVAGAAQLQVLLRDHEAVVAARQDVEARARLVREAAVGHQQAGGGARAAAHAAAELVELGQAEALGVLDHHDGGVGHVHAHLDHGGGHQHLHLARGRRRP